MNNSNRYTGMLLILGFITMIALLTFQGFVDFKVESDIKKATKTIVNVVSIERNSINIFILETDNNTFEVRVGNNADRRTLRRVWDNNSTKFQVTKSQQSIVMTYDSLLTKDNLLILEVIK